MELEEFLRNTRARVLDQISERVSTPGSPYPYEECVFTEIVMDHMEDIGLTYEPQVCHLEAKNGNARLRLSGYSISQDGEQVDLFVSHYHGLDEITHVPDKDIRETAQQCLRLLERSADGKLLKSMEEANPAYNLVYNLYHTFQTLTDIRVFVITDGCVRSKRFAPAEIEGRTVKLEVMDIERLHRHWSEGKPREDLVIDFQTVCGGPIPCVYIPGDTTGCDYALTVLPGEALRHIYDKFGPRLMEANVRSYLSAAGKDNKVNSGIRKTLVESPEHFIAFNNGIVMIADHIELKRLEDGSHGIHWMKGLQIVNGGQTTASIYFAKKKNPQVDLSRVRVAAKIIVFKSIDREQEEGLVSSISKFANSQTAVKVSDLSANKAFHVALENLASTIYCTDGESRWYYERAAGSYNVMLAQAGDKTAKQKKIQKAIPSTRKITKPDLAKFLNCWDGKPYLVSLGAQKNFEKFMDVVESKEVNDQPYVPTAAEYKQMIAKAIIYKRAYALIKPKFRADQAQITNYTVALLSDRLGSRLSLDQIWQKQELTARLDQQIETWAHQVHAILEDTKEGRSVSEWCKKTECWQIVSGENYSKPLTEIPEVAESSPSCNSGVGVDA